MRVVFVVPGSLGHLHPQAALANELVIRGHRATLVTTDDRLASVDRLGLSGVGVGPPLAVGPPPSRGASPLSGIPPVTFMRDDSAIAGLERVCRETEAEVIVHDHMGATAAVVARDLGIASVYLGVGTMRPPAMMERIDQAVAAYCDRSGRERLAHLGLYEHLHLSRCPPSLQPSAFSELPNTVSVQPFLHDGAEAGAPTWLDEYQDESIIYVTLGTWGSEPGAVDILAPIIEALAALDCQTVATVGHEGPWETLNAVAPNVRVEPYVPQRYLMELADLAVCHGGSGAILGALSAATPVVAIPQGADHFWNCERLNARGAGVALDGGVPDADDLRGVIAVSLNSEPLYVAARQVAEEIEGLPDLAESADLLEELVDR